LFENRKDLQLTLEDNIDGIVYEDLMMCRHIFPQNCSIIETLKFIFENNLLEQYPNCIVTFEIILTSSVTTATGERSFSKLTMIKNYLRSTINQ